MDITIATTINDKATLIVLLNFEQHDDEFSYTEDSIHFFETSVWVEYNIKDIDDTTTEEMNKKIDKLVELKKNRGWVNQMEFI